MQQIACAFLEMKNPDLKQLILINDFIRAKIIQSFYDE